MTQFIPCRRAATPLPLVSLGLLLLALAASIFITAEYRSAAHQPASVALAGHTPASPLGSGAAMRNLLF